MNGYLFFLSQCYSTINTDKSVVNQTRIQKATSIKAKNLETDEANKNPPNKTWLSICQYSNLSRSASSSICFASAKYVCSKCLNISATFGYLFLKSLDNFPK